MFERVRSPRRRWLRLAQWLGPWGPRDRAPTDVWCRDGVAPDHESVAPSYRLYGPRGVAPAGSYLVTPGLSLAGPADPRLDRFARVLASAGFVVLVPRLRDFEELRVTTRAVDELGAALRVLRTHPELQGSRPVLFAVSFGSLPALCVAASAEHADALGGLVIFGGLVDWRDTLAFMLSGHLTAETCTTPDPLTLPVVFINALAHFPNAPADSTPLLAAWREFAARTWPDPANKARERHIPIARTLAAALPETERRLFLQGCGVEPGGAALIESVLDRVTHDLRALDPRGQLEGLRCPVHLVHGVDDDVIPYTELDRLRRAMPAHTNVRTYLTGIYSHARAEGLGPFVRNLGGVPREVATLAALLTVLSQTRLIT